jgi:hypothetical protein
VVDTLSELAADDDEDAQIRKESTYLQKPGMLQVPAQVATDRWDVSVAAFHRFRLPGMRSLLVTVAVSSQLPGMA